MPFFIQVILGLGSPVAWHTNDATPPEMPVWSSGDLTKLGKSGKWEVKGQMEGRELRAIKEVESKREREGEVQMISVPFPHYHLKV